jgi:hypothetical protein
MRILVLVALFVTQAFAQQQPIENGWLGITVFQTSRAEVEQLLGVPPQTLLPTETTYVTKEGKVHFVYSALPCTNRGDGRFVVAENTVLEYRFYFKEGIDISKLKWSANLYERHVDSHNQGLTHYSNLKDGIALTTEVESGVEKVFILRFTRPSSCAERLSCAKFK